jgi:peroxiredoxin
MSKWQESARCGLLTLCFLLLPLSVVSASEFALPASLGKVIPNFKLPDHQGKVHNLSEHTKQKVVVLALLGTECPLAKLYSLRLSKLAETYRDKGVTILGIDANRQDSLADIGAFVRQHDLKFPLLKDAGNRVADFLGAIRTPEVFVLDEKRVVRYYGRIDNQYGIGYAKDAPTQNDLQLAIDELLAGKAVTNPAMQPVGCHIGRMRKPLAESTVTYSNQISRLLAQHCVECHRPGEIAPFSLTDYEEVAGWAATMAEVVKNERMPPWHANEQHGTFSNDRRLSDEEKDLIRQWAEAGAPEGNPSELPAAKTYTTGWQLPQQPDLVLEMSKKPYMVPPEGVLRYQEFIVDPKFTEDKWISAVEVQPGNRAVVHHALVIIRPPGARSNTLADLDAQILGVYVPGMRPRPWPQGTAKRIQAGGILVFELHYVPIGTEEPDISRIGLVFTDASTVTHAVLSAKAVQRHITIPPGESNYTAKASIQAAPVDAQLISVMPHMHLRGKSFRYQALYPDGTLETLLDVPHYDFNWQTSYWFAEPKRMAAGTKIVCDASFDNSTANLANPDPAATVTWGAQSWQEMMIGYCEFSVPVNVVRDEKSVAVPTPSSTIMVEAADKALRQRAGILMKKYDKNGDDRVTVEELPLAQRSMLRTVDTDGDGGISSDELIRSFKK